VISESEASIDKTRKHYLKLVIKKSTGTASMLRNNEMRRMTRLVVGRSYCKGDIDVSR
jgi:hypothetical protein